MRRFGHWPSVSVACDTRRSPVASETELGPHAGHLPATHSALVYRPCVAFCGHTCKGAKRSLLALPVDVRMGFLYCMVYALMCLFCCRHSLYAPRLRATANMHGHAGNTGCRWHMLMHVTWAHSQWCSRVCECEATGASDGGRWRRRAPVVPTCARGARYVLEIEVDIFSDSREGKLSKRERGGWKSEKSGWVMKWVDEVGCVGETGVMRSRPRSPQPPRT